MPYDKNSVLNLDTPIPTVKWSDGHEEGSLPSDVERFKANLIMLDTPTSEIEQAVNTIQADLRRWYGIGSPYFTTPPQIDGFNAYLVECDPDLDMTHICPETRRRIEEKIGARRSWAGLASRAGSEGHFAQAFKHYDEGLYALWPSPGSPGFRDFIEESALQFRQQLADGAVPLGRSGIGIKAYDADRRHYLQSSSEAEVENTLSVLKTKLVLASRPEASIYNVEVEAVCFSLWMGRGAAALRVLIDYSDLWWSLGRPRFSSGEDVEAFIAFGLLRRWYGHTRPGEAVPDSTRCGSSTIRGFCEALTSRTIRPITDFARELAAYHPLFEENDYYADAQDYYEYLRAASARYSGVVPRGDIEF